MVAADVVLQLQGMLARNPSHRLTANQVLEHPFISQRASLSSEHRDQAFKGIQKLSGKRQGFSSGSLFMSKLNGSKGVITTCLLIFHSALVWGAV